MHLHRRVLHASAVVAAADVAAAVGRRRRRRRPTGRAVGVRPTQRVDGLRSTRRQRRTDVVIVAPISNPESTDELKQQQQKKTAPK